MDSHRLLEVGATLQALLSSCNYLLGILKVPPSLAWTSSGNRPFTQESESCKLFIVPVLRKINSERSSIQVRLQLTSKGNQVSSRVFISIVVWSPEFSVKSLLFHQSVLRFPCALLILSHWTRSLLTHS